MSKQWWLVLLHRLKQPLSEGADCLLPRVAEKPKAEIIGEKYRIVAIGKDADAKRLAASAVRKEPEGRVLPVQRVDARIRRDHAAEYRECLHVQVVNDAVGIGDRVSE